MNNVYHPRLAKIEKVIIENQARDIKTFKLVFSENADREQFKFGCGQFAMISVLGAGESPIGIASSPLDEGFLEFTVKRYPTGVVTTALHDFEPGERVGVRGPYGNSFPLEAMTGKNIVIVGGGFAVTTLRSTIRYLLNERNRALFENIIFLYGARSPGELIYKSELKEWERRQDITTHITVDKGDEGWTGKVGLVPQVLKEVSPSARNSVSLICGPPIMLKYTIPPLLDLGFRHKDIFTSLERRMSCGIGKCGRCNVGSKYVCKDGPVFSYEELQRLPEEVL